MATRTPRGGAGGQAHDSAKGLATAHLLRQGGGEPDVVVRDAVGAILQRGACVLPPAEDEGVLGRG